MLKSEKQSPSLFIKAIRVLGNSGIVLELSDLRRGINVIRGENSSGRTTLLKLFEFGFGADITVSRFFIPEIQECQRLLMEIELNGVIYTIDRKFGHGSNRVIVYQGAIDLLLRNESHFSVGDEFSDFLLYRLDIPSIHYLDNYRERERKITFNDLYDALYIDQERGLSQIHARAGETKRKHVFKLLTKISLPDLYQVEVEEESLKKKRSDLENDFQAISRFFGSVNLPTPFAIQSQINQLNEQRSELEIQFQDLKLKLRSNPAYVDPLRTEILNLETILAAKQKDSFLTKQTLESYAELENQLYEDIDRISRVRISAIQLASFKFEKCPRCLQNITEEMQHNESIGNCGLCNRPLIKDSDDTDSLERHETQIKSQLDELLELQHYYRNSVSDIENEISILQTEVDEKRQALDDILREFVSPFLQEIESFGYKTAAANEEINRLTGLLQWRERLQKMREELEELSSEILKVQEQKKVLIEQEKLLRMALSNFEDYFYQFVSRTYPDFLDAKIDQNTFLPIINGYDYTVKSATQRNMAILGYYYALLRFSLENSSNIPRFLIIDTLRRDDLSDDLYSAVLNEFKGLEDIYNKSFQLFLVVRELVEFLRDDEILQLVDGKRLLRVEA